MSAWSSFPKVTRLDSTPVRTEASPFLRSGPISASAPRTSWVRPESVSRHQRASPSKPGWPTTRPSTTTSVSPAITKVPSRLRAATACPLARALVRTTSRGSPSLVSSTSEAIAVNSRPIDLSSMRRWGEREARMILRGAATPAAYDELDALLHLAPAGAVAALAADAAVLLPLTGAEPVPALAAAEDVVALQALQEVLAAEAGDDVAAGGTDQ